jgi:hypothetical protein
MLKFKASKTFFEVFRIGMEDMLGMTKVTPGSLVIVEVVIEVVMD